MPEWGIVAALVLGAIMGGMIYYSRNSCQSTIFQSTEESRLKSLLQRHSSNYKIDPDIALYKKNIGVYPNPSWTYGQIKEANMFFE